MKKAIIWARRLPEAKLGTKLPAMKEIVSTHKSEKIPPLNKLLSAIGKGKDRINVRGLEASARAFLTALLFRLLPRSLLIICAQEDQARAFARDASLFLGEDNVIYYPPSAYFAVDVFSFTREEELTRLALLARLQTEQKTLVVTCVDSLLEKIIPVDVFAANTRVVSRGNLLDTEELAVFLSAAGYRRVSLVEETGEFSMRGNIIDVFSPREKNPVRLEMSADEIESLRVFDISSQRSLHEVDSCVLSPASQIIVSKEKTAQAVRNIKARADELALPRDMRKRLAEMIKNSSADMINPNFLPFFYEGKDAADNFSASGLSGLCDYLPDDTLLIFEESFAVLSARQAVQEKIQQTLSRQQADAKFYPAWQSSYFSDEQISAALARFQQIYFAGFDLLPGNEEKEEAVVFETRRESPSLDPLPGEIREDALLRHVATKIRAWLNEGMLVFLVCPTPEDVARMSHLLSLQDLSLRVLPSKSLIADFLGEGVSDSALVLCEGKISAGFVFPAMRLVFLNEEEIFVRKKTRHRRPAAREAYFLNSFGDLKEGDYVVHKDFGIGVYRGLKKITVGKIENDYLVIEYLDADKLYIPVNALERIQRYLGPEGYTPKVDRMGGTSWEAVKEKVKKSMREIAEELVSVYAAREIMERKSFTPPDELYNEFCATFAFEETPDQSKAIEDVHADMDDVKPMDRLICGDAGFGKTEVAVRAAFRAVMDGKQVAVLTPTTILAEQHYRTFSERVGNFPVRVEVLNRFKGAAAQRKILEDLKSQRIDVLIGTHRLLQKDVEFKNLGLLIVDEEQRFGVTHKEKLKKLRPLVDVLTLSATPIPRTLHLSLVGIRDLSIITTPPEERLPIKTYVLEFGEHVIREAVEKELTRAGQVFFVHDRVRSIYSIARMLQELVPRAKVGVVHGQMKASEIEKSMTSFLRREIDVLVSTTIVASGLDIPTANTIIINRADRLGLAQLYQLRGRVGRSDKESFAYLLLPPGAMLSVETMKRLQALKEFSQPGSGFRIARNDLEIRGGGNLLGVSQSGHIRAVGYELYTELMEKTMREMKGEKIAPDDIVPEIQLGVSAFIPEEYVQDVYQRLVLYKRISLAAGDEEIERIKSELIDCYGVLPETTENLLQVIKIRNRLKLLHGKKMGYDGREMYIHFRETSPLAPQKIIEVLHKEINSLRFTPQGKLFFPFSAPSAKEILNQAACLLNVLAQ